MSELSYELKIKAINFWGNERLAAKMVNQYPAVIIMCPRCKRVDIHPVAHIDECNPQGEYNRQQEIDHFWGQS